MFNCRTLVGAFQKWGSGFKCNTLRYFYPLNNNHFTSLCKFPKLSQFFYELFNFKLFLELQYLIGQTNITYYSKTFRLKLCYFQSTINYQQFRVTLWTATSSRTQKVCELRKTRKEKPPPYFMSTSSRLTPRDGFQGELEKLLWKILPIVSFFNTFTTN
jgi:hypothetical protein